MSESIPTFERVILRNLFESTGPVDLFEFHSKYRLSAAQVFEFCEHYESKGFLKRDGLFAQLNEAGRIYVWENRHSLFSVGRSPAWRYIKPVRDWRQRDDAVKSPHFKWLDKNFDLSSTEEFLRVINKK